MKRSFPPIVPMLLVGAALVGGCDRPVDPSPISDVAGSMQVEPVAAADSTGEDSIAAAVEPLPSAAEVGPCVALRAAGVQPAPAVEVPAPPASDFHDGRARVQDRMTRCYGYLGTDGTYAIPPRFSHASAFSEGFAAAAEADTFGYIDEEGHWAILPRFDGAEPFEDGRAWARVDGRWGRIDQTGAFLTAPRFEQRFATGGRLVHVVEDERVGLYDPEADSLVVEPTFGWVFPSEGELTRAAMGTVRDVVRWGYVDEDEAWAVMPQFEGVGAFVGDTAFVLLPDTSGVRWGEPHIGGPLARIDRTGRVLDRLVLDARHAVVEQPLRLALPDSLFEPSPNREPLLRQWARLLVGPATAEGEIVESSPIAEEGYESAAAALYPQGVTFVGSYGYESSDEALILPGVDFEEAAPQVETLARRLFRVEVEPEREGDGVRFIDEEVGYASLGVWPTETGVVVRWSWGL